MLPLVQVHATRAIIRNDDCGSGGGSGTGGGGGVVTITVAVPKIDPCVALTVLLNVPVVVPAVKSPVLLLMVPPPFVTDQTGVMATTLPLPSLPTAVNCTCAPVSIVAGFGVTVIVASGGGGGAVTIAVAVPKIVPEVALTVLSNVPVVLPAVKSPDPALMVPPPFVTDQTGVIATIFPPASLPTAVNCCCAPVCIDAGLGVTVMVASGPAITVTLAVPKIVPDVALTLAAKVPVVLPAVKSPLVETIVPGGLVVVQSGVIATMLPNESRPTAVNCCVAPIASVGFGVTVMVASGPAVTVIVAVAVNPPHVTVTVLVPGVDGAVNNPVLLTVPPPAVTA